MSSLAKASKSQKTHRERHQPEDRKSLGLLEKRKDYKLRAADFNRKNKIIKKLRKKALNKNPDEFYFHMIRSQCVDGEGYRDNKIEPEFTEDQIALMQTQDIKYVIHKRSVEKRKIEKLKAALHLISTRNDSQNTHTFFVDTDSEKRGFDVAKRLNTHESLLDRTYNRPTMSALKQSDRFSETNDKNAEKIRERAYRELEQRIKRERQLGIVQEKMQMKRLLQNKKDKPVAIVKHGDKNSAPVFKWAQERKR